MKIVCSKENLLNGINTVQKAVSSKSTLQILEGILLKAGKEFKMTGNDFEIGIECCVDTDILAEGAVVLNSRIFGEIVRRLPDSEVLIECRENNLVVIECDNSYFEIKGLSAAGFPALQIIEAGNGFKISQKTIRDMIRQTIFAVSTDENRPILTGSLIECKDGGITVVSIDGYRLAMRTDRVQSDIEEISVVVPGKTLNEISKILQPVDDEVNVFCTNNQILFDLGRTKIISRLLEGEYLNYKSIIPYEYDTKITVDKRDFLSSLERASLIITSEERRYPVNFDISNDRLIITSNTEVGNVREEMALEMEGSDVEIAFNPKYFIEALRVIEDEKINVFFTSSIGPCTIRPVNGESYAYLILPVRR
jgi:DNA polymerase-3 subunit beta